MHLPAGGQRRLLGIALAEVCRVQYDCLKALCRRSQSSEAICYERLPEQLSTAGPAECSLAAEGVVGCSPAAVHVLSGGLPGVV